MKRNVIIMKKFLVSALLICMLSALFVISGPFASADGYAAPEVQTTVPAGYTGIYSVSDLAKISVNLNSSYILMANIDLKGVDFSPIGSEAKPFGGVFDGNGHTIKNISISLSLNQKSACVGFFGSSTGTIKNLILSDMSIDVNNTNGKLLIGGIAGKNQGTISNCKVTATISGTTTATVSTMNTEVLVGGIAGENRSSSHLDMHGQIKSCEVYGSVFSKAIVPETSERGYAYAGGIAGQNNVMNTAITCCTNNAKVEITESNHAIAGGIVGDQLSGQISYCVNKGTVKAAGGNVIVGGIAGSNNTSGEVFCCANYGRVSASSEYRSFKNSDTTVSFGSIRAGGVLGENSFAKFSASYSMGPVEYQKTGDVKVECGGAYGATDGGHISDCYYLDSSVIATDVDSRVDVPLSSADFANPAFFPGFDFIDAWEMSSDGFPILTMKTAHTHTPSEWTVKSYPTCTENGREIIICTGCNEVLQARDIPAVGHDYGEPVIIEPTCTEGGRKYAECKVCHEVTELEHYEPKGHTPGEPVTVPSTCYSEGTRTVSCTVCGEVLETETFAKTDHTPGDWQVSESPTCTHEGTEERRCTVCSALIESRKIAPNGHKPGEWTVVKEPTCTEDGVRTRVCGVCGETFTQRILKTGHTAGEWIVTEEPTCAHTGTKVKLCTVCGEQVESEIIPVKEHHYVDGVCEYCGEKEPVTTEATETEATETKATEPQETQPQTDKQTESSAQSGGEKKSAATVIIIIVVAVAVIGGAVVLIFITSKKK